MNYYLLLADLVLIIHFAFVVFVVLGFLLIAAGRWFGWQFIFNRYFRGAHFGAIGVVVLQAWLGQLCPLTVWENELRRLAGEAGYAGSFIQYWLHRVLFYEAEPWVFGLVYSVFGGLVLALFWWDWRCGRLRAGHSAKG